MKFRQFLTKRSLMAFATALVVSLATGVAQADKMVKVRTVKCDKGEHPEDVLELNPGPQPLVIRLEGTCPSFAINRDDVLVFASAESGCRGATVAGTIFIRGQRAFLGCLTVTRPGSGVVATSNASVVIRDSLIYDNNGFGVSAAQSTVSISASEISNNVKAGVFANGAKIGINGDSHVINNQGAGVELNTNSSADIDQAQIRDNDSDDLFLSLHSVAAGADNTIERINLQNDSGVVFDGTSFDTINCDDEESSAKVNGISPVGGCTGF